LLLRRPNRLHFGPPSSHLQAAQTLEKQRIPLRTHRRASASQAEGRGFESRFPLQTKQDTAFRSIPPQDIPRESRRTPALQDAVAAFVLSRQVGNCSAATVRLYQANLARLARDTGAHVLPDLTTPRLQRYLTGLRDTMQPVSVHQHYRTLRTFLGWCCDAGLIAHNPLRGVTMRLPRTLPRVPDDDTVRRLLQACGDTFEGRRNRALVALLADSGLRIAEALRLRIEDVQFATRTLQVRAGKGGKDGVGFFGAEAQQALRAWLGARAGAQPEDCLFTDREGRPLSRAYGTRLLHRLSRRAGLPRKVGPHALRHYAATSILRQTGDLDLVRRVLRHETLHMALRYAHLAQPDVSRKFRRASPLDALRVGR
jgi:site-specific recombinase XerD